jgi:adenosylcobinamide-GDP ribazoletransferase
MTWAGMRLAVTLLTAIPVRGAGRVPTRPLAGAAMAWAPAVGLLLGAVAAGVLELAAGVAHTGPLLGAVLAITVLAALTRGLHLDGLADWADGLGSRRPAAQALDIMKRPEIGPYGVAVLVLTLLIHVAAVARAEQIGRGLVAVSLAAVTGRLAMTLACRRGIPPARRSGLGALVAGTVPPALALALVAVVLAGAAGAGCAQTSGWVLATGWIFPVAAAAGLMASVLITWLAVRRLGGVTGDVLGASGELATAACLIVTAIR